MSMSVMSVLTESISHVSEVWLVHWSVLQLPWQRTWLTYHASDVWREGRRGRGAETRHRRLENNEQTTGKEFVVCINFIINFVIIIFRLKNYWAREDSVIIIFLFLVTVFNFVKIM